MPIPKPVVNLSFNAPLPPPKPAAAPKKLDPPPVNEAQEIDLTVKELQVNELDDLCLVDQLVLTASCSLVSADADEDAAAVVVCPDVEQLECPPAKKKPSLNSCRKHSRCHCNLLSLEVDDFFQVVPE